MSIFISCSVLVCFPQNDVNIHFQISKYVPIVLVQLNFASKATSELLGEFNFNMVEIYWLQSRLIISLSTVETGQKDEPRASVSPAVSSAVTPRLRLPHQRRRLGEPRLHRAVYSLASRVVVGRLGFTSSMAVSQRGRELLLRFASGGRLDDGSLGGSVEVGGPRSCFFGGRCGRSRPAPAVARAGVSVAPP
jgi:hypothetical protein